MTTFLALLGLIVVVGFGTAVGMLAWAKHDGAL